MRTTTRKTTTARFPYSIGMKTSQPFETEVFDNKINGFINNVETLIRQRANQYGGQDPVAKKLKKATSNAKGCMRRKNVVCDNMTRSLHQINRSLRGASNVPQTIRTNYKKLQRYLRDHVRQNVIKFCQLFQKSLKTTGNEIHKIETYLARQLGAARSGQIAYKVDPEIKRMVKTLDRKVVGFKSKWFKIFNLLSTHGNRSVDAQVNKVKKEINALQQSIRKCYSLLNRASRTGARRQKGVRVQTLIPKSKVNTIHRSWLKYERALTNFNTEIQQFVEQLKATKTL